MKTLTKILMIIVATLFVVSATAQDEKVKLRKNEAQVTYSASIDCAGCVAKLEAKLPSLKGVKDFKVSLEKQTIWLVYDVRKTDVDKLQIGLYKLGYKVKKTNK